MLPLSRLRLNFHQKLLLLTFIPVLGLMGVGGYFLQRLFTEDRAAQFDATMMERYAAGHASSLVLARELQAERNLAFVCVGLGETPARAAALAQQQAATDRAVAAELTWLAANSKLIDNAEFAQIIDGYHEVLTTFLAGVRRDVKDHKPIATLMADYTRVIFGPMATLEGFRQLARNPETLSYFDGIYTLNKMREQDAMIASLFVIGAQGYVFKDEDAAVIRKQYFGLMESETYVRRFFRTLRVEFDQALRTDEESVAYYKYLADLSARLKGGDKLPPFPINAVQLPAMMESRAARYVTTLDRGFALAQEALRANAAHKHQLTIGITTAIVLVLALSLVVNLAVARHLQKALRSVSNAIHESSGDVHAAAEQLTQASDQISANASSYAAALEEVGAALHDISDTAKQNDNHGAEADRRAAQATASVRTGQAAIGELGVAMDSIRASGQKITKIVARINDISFQTNILALNAAVEAARAGEAGAGFSVVAEEVRRLAKLCAEAAAETSELVDESAQSAEVAGDKSGRVQHAFEEIATSVSDVATLISQISRNHHQQSGGIEQVKDAVSRQEGVAQSTAAVAEETASAALSMTAQVDALARSVEALDAILGGTRAVVPRVAVTELPPPPVRNGVASASRVPVAAGRN